MVAETDGVTKLVPGATVFAGGLGILAVRDPWISLGMSVSLTGTAWMMYAVLKDILDRFNMTLADLL